MAVAGKIHFEYCPSIYGCRSVVEYLDEDIEQRFVVSGNVMRATFSLPMFASVWVKTLLFIPPGEYRQRENILRFNPLNLMKKYMRKCLGKSFQPKNKNVKRFCQSTSFELKLGVEINAKKCGCHSDGIEQSTSCDPYTGDCICRPGFMTRDCSVCIVGSFPDCQPDIITSKTDKLGANTS